MLHSDRGKHICSQCTHGHRLFDSSDYEKLMTASWRNAADPYGSQSEIILVQENNRHEMTPSQPH